MKKIFISTGGTGGHIFPIISIAEYLKKKDLEIIIFTDHRAKKFLVNNSDYNINYINITTPTGKTGFKFIYSVFRIGCLFIYFLFFIFFQKPDLIIGSGGYVSFPILLAAKILKKKFIIYETNSIIGRVNKFFINSSKICLTGFDKINIKNNNIKFVGQLIRNQIINLNQQIIENKKNNKEFNLLIIGGSQGAAVFNNLLPNIINKLLDIHVKINVFHQVGKKEEIDNVRKNYKHLENIKIFDFEPNIEKYIKLSDLVITRAGSSTLAELVYLQIPFISVPFEKSLDNHQFYNANYFYKKNVCWLIEQKDLETTDKLFLLLKNIIANKELLLEKINNLKDLKLLNVNEAFFTQIHKLLV